MEKYKLSTIIKLALNSYQMLSISRFQAIKKKALILHTIPTLNFKAVYMNE